LIAYVDTSALVKLLIDEPDTSVAGRAWEAADLRIASVLVYPEARAAIGAGRRARRLTRADADAAVNDLEGRWEEIHRIDVTPPLAHAAGLIADRDGLRGADAVHLATALGASDGTDLLLLTWDGALARAARRHGLATIAGV
jgi:predicted nucleic acid-binding protein